MGDADEKRVGWPSSESFLDTIELHMLPPIAALNGARIRELTGDESIPNMAEIVLRAHRAVVGARTFGVGFCLGNEYGFSAIGIAVIERLMMEFEGATLHVVPVVYKDIAWDIVLRHLRSFTSQVLLFAFPDSDVYDAGTAEMFYSTTIQVIDPNGAPVKRLTNSQRQRVREQAAKILNRPPPPKFYEASHVALENTPWIFRFTTPAGKIVRTAVWNGRRDYAHEFPADIIRWVGGEKIAIVQVDSPVGVNRRSSIELTHFFAKDFDGIIHWARGTETFQSILKSFIRLEFESVAPLKLPDEWKPTITMFGANTDYGT